MNKIKNLGKMPKRKVTIDDVLWRDDIDSTIKDVIEKREDFTELLCIGVTNDEIWWRHSNMLESRIVYLAEVVKNCILNKEDD